MEAFMILEMCKEKDRDFINDVIFNDIVHTPINQRQGRHFLQMFMNYTGLSYKEPVVLTEEAFCEKWNKCEKPEILYHMDFCSQKEGIRQFRVLRDTTSAQALSYTQQHMGILKDENGKPFGEHYTNSVNLYGNGLYLGKYEFYEWIHKIHRLKISGSAFKCFVNPNTKIITPERLIKAVNNLRENIPTFDYLFDRLNKFNGEYIGWIYSELATILGYDIIAVPEDENQMGFRCDFTTTSYCVLNRSVITICDQVTAYDSANLISGNWKEPGKNLFRGGGVKTKCEKTLRYKDSIVFDGDGHYAIKRRGEESYGQWQELPLKCKNGVFY